MPGVRLHSVLISIGCILLMVALFPSCFLPDPSVIRESSVPSYDLLAIGLAGLTSVFVGIGRLTAFERQASRRRARGRCPTCGSDLLLLFAPLEMCPHCGDDTNWLADELFRASHCRRCRYDLRGNRVPMCPECGCEVKRTDWELLTRWRRTRQEAKPHTPDDGSGQVRDRIDGSAIDG